MDDVAPYGDPLSIPFWNAAARHRLVVQRCKVCGHHQLYPRPYCLACYSDQVQWVEARGTGVVYTKTIVHMQVLPELTPPYAVAVVELDEGPRLTTNLTDIDVQIGDRVLVTWRERDNAPPFPQFQPLT
jgi:uncharacterized OB-fold protein